MEEGDIVQTKRDFEKLKGLRTNVIDVLAALRTKLRMVQGVIVTFIFL